MNGLRYPLHALCLQELKNDVERATVQLGTVFPQGHFVLDTTVNGRVGIFVALPKGQVVLDQGSKGDGSLS